MNDSQPSFADFGRPLFDVTFCVVDLETTGTGNTDGITEIGAVKVRGGKILEEFQTLVNPQQTISPYVTNLTSITNEMVAEAPTMAQVLPMFLSFAAGCVLVAHNARFDIGFLRRACTKLDYHWPNLPVLDTMLFAQRALSHDEVPNHRLATLASYFRTSVTPDHRALSDAKATVDVLHGLIERACSFGAHTYEELTEFMNWISPMKKAKRNWVSKFPRSAGVYLFIHESDDKKQVLYVGKSRNLQARVRTYFSASETRPWIDNMLTLATGIDWITCETPLAAEVLALRLIEVHRPKYNRRSKFTDDLNHHRVSSIATCPEIVATAPSDDGWHIHVIRYGRLSGSGRILKQTDLDKAIQTIRLAAETVNRPILPTRTALARETQLIATWLNRPEVRLIEISEV